MAVRSRNSAQAQDWAAKRADAVARAKEMRATRAHGKVEDDSTFAPTYAGGVGLSMAAVLLGTGVGPGPSGPPAVFQYGGSGWRLGARQATRVAGVPWAATAGPRLKTHSEVRAHTWVLLHLRPQSCCATTLTGTHAV